MPRASRDWIPILRPRLPEACALVPYLQRIDHNRIYTNWGPLSFEFERRLAAHLRVPDGCVISASSGTAALVGAILATAGRAQPNRPLALIPAFTFVATALAAEQCGYQPYLVDVDPQSWQMDFDRLDPQILTQAGIVIPVAPFGRAVPQDLCARFYRQTGLPVIVDGGASFEAVSADPDRYLGAIPVAMSFHATKSFSTGEGGCVAVNNRKLAELVTQSLNFGFYANRECAGPSTNGKMSEYHAAIGLAELDAWPAKQQALCGVGDRYRQYFSSAGIVERFVGAPSTASCYALWQCEDTNDAGLMQDHLASASIESRLWYGAGLHSHPYYQHARRDPLGVTSHIAPLILGLPVAPDLAAFDIERIVCAIHGFGRSDL